MPAKRLPAWITAATLLPSFSSSAQQPTPEIPAIRREVTGVVRGSVANPLPEPAFTRPHIPSFRTTADGRLALTVEWNCPAFTVMKPEKLKRPVLLEAAGSYTMSDAGMEWGDGMSQSDWRKALCGWIPNRIAAHSCLWDDTPPFADDALRDVYDLKVVVTANYDDNGLKKTQIFMTPVRVVVSSPKTPDAAVQSVTITGPTVAGPEYSFGASGFEPVVVGDGRLLVLRVNSQGVQWTEPQGNGQILTTTADIVYSYYDDPAFGTADPRGWSNLIPIAHAHSDLRLCNRFGFAAYPLRDSEGDLLSHNVDMGGSYPWMDRDADNLFFELVRDRLHYESPPDIWKHSRYGPASLDPDDPHGAWGEEDAGPTRGVSFAGLWSRGKIVQIDNLVNDMDYGIGAAGVQVVGDPARPGPQRRIVPLYEPRAGASEEHKVVLGYGRATAYMPPGENNNANIIDSIESKLNHRAHARPMTFRDVVWHVSVGKHTDELAFDDYLDIDALVVADMNGATDYPDPPSAGSMNRHGHLTGWKNSPPGFTEPVHLQNAAAPPTERWNVPRTGEVFGGRLEPIASGGVRGKGFWMDGTTRVRFGIPAQTDPERFAQHDYYLGLFVDCRFEEGVEELHLVSFPDGSSIRLWNRRQIRYYAGTDELGRITLPEPDPSSTLFQLEDLLPDGGWAHLGFQIRDGGRSVEFLLNGLPYHRWVALEQELFVVQAGDLWLGAASPVGADSFRGWVDEFKFLAHTVDPETACNHAGGTLVGLPDYYAGPWKAGFADRYPAWAHERIRAWLQNSGQTTYPSFACFHDHTGDRRAHRGNLPCGTCSVREDVLFPEGPLYHDAPRPDSTYNQFCTTCHVAGGGFGLGLDALAARAIVASADERRQPSQPPARLHGVLPEGLVDTGSSAMPSSQIIAPPGGQPVDEWMMPSYTGPAQVVSFSLIDVATHEVLMEIENGTEIDFAALGEPAVTIRANLRDDQGSVSLWLDGGPRTVSAHGPHLLFEPAIGDPFVAGGLSPGTHTVHALPEGAEATAEVVAQFEVLAGVREIARYSEAFQAGSPADGWFYLWSPDGDLSAPEDFVRLAWYPGAGGHYSAQGLGYPEASTEGAYATLTGVGGHPGAATGNGQAVIASYRVPADGYYRVTDLSIGDAGGLGAAQGSPGWSGDGGFLEVRKVQNGVSTMVLSCAYSPSNALTGVEADCAALVAGDLVQVCVSPGATSVSDQFVMDYAIEFGPSPF